MRAGSTQTNLTLTPCTHSYLSSYIHTQMSSGNQTPLLPQTNTGDSPLFFAKNEGTLCRQ